MSDKKVLSDSFYASIGAMLKDYKYQVDDATKKVVKSVAKDSAKVVQSHTPSNWSEDYKSAIVSSTPKLERGNYVSHVHVEGEDYRVAHLLENGHALVRGGRTLGRARAFPHFKYGEEYAERELPKRLEEAIK